MIQKFFSTDDFYLLRQHIKEVYDEAVAHIQNSSDQLNILEIGPCKTVHFPEFETSWISNNASSLGHNYKTFDIIGDVDYVGTIEDCSNLFEDNSFDVIIMLSVLEHVENIFSASKELARIVKPGGKVFLETPFLWKVHGPVPDYWRISEYAYQFLFKENFNITLNTFPENEFGKNSLPLSYGAILEKK